MAGVDEGDLLSMKRWRTGMMVVLALVALVVAVSVDARVFKIRGLAFGGGRFDYSAIGRRLYGAVMEVDGRSVDVSVIRAEGRMEEVVGGLRGTGGQGRYKAGDGMGIGEIRDGGQCVRMLTLPMMSGSESLVIAVQSGEAGAGKATPMVTDMAGVPVYREAVVKRVLRNTDTGTTLWQAATADEPRVAMAFYRSAFEGEGWQPALPRAAARGGPELECFVRGRDLCWVFCQRVESDGGTRLTVVNKRAGLNGTMGDR